uniref:NFX1-type zinc finger-containing protein 1 n=2 Tax=Hirondellea gigas TaxID=1518452 RepID=A0A6A7FSJ0_9CRUS
MQRKEMKNPKAFLRQRNNGNRNGNTSNISGMRSDLVGKILSFYEEKGFGFIRCDSIEESIYFRSSNFEGYKVSILRGATVVFDAVYQDDRQRRDSWRANRIRIPEGQNRPLRFHEIMQYLDNLLLEPVDKMILTIFHDFVTWIFILTPSKWTDRRNASQFPQYLTAVLNVLSRNGISTCQLRSSVEEFLKTTLNSEFVNSTHFMSMISNAESSDSLLKIIRFLELIHRACGDSATQLVSIGCALLRSNTSTSGNFDDDEKLLSGVDCLQELLISPKILPNVVVEQCSHYLNAKIHPSTKDMQLSMKDVLKTVPIIPKKGPFESHLCYLDTMFSLLHTDCFASIHEGIQRMMTGDWDYHILRRCGVRLYQNCQILGLHLFNSGKGLAFTLQFPISKSSKQQILSKRLVYGQLVCLSIDGFESTHYWATIENHDELYMKRGITFLKFEDPRSELLIEQSMKRKGVQLSMLESTTFFLAYGPALRAIQRIPHDNLGFCQQFAETRSNRERPSYLSSIPSYKIKKILTISGFDTLDDTQQKAVKLCLNEELCLIQGPPGTGKTFTALKIIKILHMIKTQAVFRSGEASMDQQEVLTRIQHVQNTQKQLRAKFLEAINASKPSQNHYCSRGSNSNEQIDQIKMERENARSELLKLLEIRDEMKTRFGPIILIAYKNHALDQMLTGCLKITENIVRIGGRSRNESLTDYNLNSLSRKLSTSVKYRDVYRATLDRVCDQMRALKKKFQSIAKSFETHLSVSIVEQFAYETQHNYLFGMNNSHKHKTLENWLKPPNLSIKNPQLQKKQTEKKKWQRKVEKSSEKKDRNLFAILQESDDEDDEEKESYVRSSSVGSNISKASSRDNQYDDESDEEKIIENELEDNYRIRRSFSRRELADNRRKEYAESFVSLEWSSKAINLDKNEAKSFDDVDDVWSLNHEQRITLAEYWIGKSQESLIKASSEERNQLRKEYDDAIEEYQEIRRQCNLNVLQSADIIGVTITGCSMNHDLLRDLQPKITIVEEAAEITEAHLIACLGPKLEHLILLGDHKQLQPSVECHSLVLHNNFHISLFERLVSNGFPHVTLGFQRRMDPDISRSIKMIYPDLQDDKSVLNRPFSRNSLKVPGFDQRIFFWTHQTNESIVNLSRMNLKEIEMIKGLIKYLLTESISPKSITILAAYNGQVSALRKEIAEIHKEIDVQTIDRFQGDENDIVILSLIRRNTDGKIGFLDKQNRFCVAMSRARHLLIVCGDLDFIVSNASTKESKEFWGIMKTDADERKISSNYLPIICPRHRSRFDVNSNGNLSFDFCSSLCDYNFTDCNHNCQNKCHYFHEDNHPECHHPCEEILKCSHECSMICSRKPCPPCQVFVTKILKCNHIVRDKCSRPINLIKCYERCEKLCSNKHQCSERCNVSPCSACNEKVPREMKCGHIQISKCSTPLDRVVCKTPCSKLLICGHCCILVCGVSCTSKSCLECAEILEKERLERIKDARTKSKAIAAAINPADVFQISALNRLDGKDNYFQIQTEAEMLFSSAGTVSRIRKILNPKLEKKFFCRISKLEDPTSTKRLLFHQVNHVLEGIARKGFDDPRCFSDSKFHPKTKNGISIDKALCFWSGIPKAISPQQKRAFALLCDVGTGKVFQPKANARSRLNLRTVREQNGCDSAFISDAKRRTGCNLIFRMDQALPRYLIEYELLSVENVSSSLLKVLQKFHITNGEAVKKFVDSAHVSNAKHAVNSVLQILRDIDYSAPDDEKDERIMFHATSIDVCTKVQKKGNCFVQSVGGTLGPGIYFAPSPEKSWAYTKGDVKSMLLCLVNIQGASTYGSGSMLEYCIDSPQKCKPLYIIIFD